MRRAMILMATALALVASACGGSAEDDFRSQMVDNGLMTDENVDCVLAAFAEEGISVSSLSDSVLGDDDIPEDAQEVVFECLASGLDFDDSGIDTKGDDAALDALWDGCAAGDGEACDGLYFESPVGSDYERFGDTCGDRLPDGAVLCGDEMG